MGENTLRNFRSTPCFFVLLLTCVLHAYLAYVQVNSISGFITVPYLLGK